MEKTTQKTKGHWEMDHEPARRKSKAEVGTKKSWTKTEVKHLDEEFFENFDSMGEKETDIRFQAWNVPAKSEYDLLEKIVFVFELT